MKGNGEKGKRDLDTGETEATGINTEETGITEQTERLLIPVLRYLRYLRV